MDFGRFAEEGKRYEVLTPLTPSPWKNPLFNDGYFMELSQTLQGGGFRVKAYNRVPCMNEYRYFYLVDETTGEVWNPNYAPLMTMPEKYVCSFGIWDTKLKSMLHGIESEIRAVVPTFGAREIWSVSLKNRGAEARKLSLYTVFGFYDHGVMGGECTCDEASHVILKYAFPYHTLYEEKEKVETDMAYAYLFSDQKPDSWEMSKKRFWGSSPESCVPKAVKEGRLSGVCAEAEDFCGAFAFRIHLEPGESYRLFLEAGAACKKQEALERKQHFCPEEIAKELQETEAFWENRFADFYLETPDQNINAFGNYWLKKQIALLTVQNRGSSYCPVRNQLQDAMGYGMICPEDAKKFILDILKLQQKNGFIQQWHDTTKAPPRGLCLLKHTDGPVWLAVCTESWIRQTGKRELLMLQVPYADGGTGTILEHMKAALLYLAENVGAHGLCLMGDGDWNDPINGAGRLGRGESVWLSMALVYAIRVLLPYLEEADADVYEKLAAAGERMKANINAHAWCRKWYAAAIHDDGTLLGDETDRLFLNTQSWAILSGVADKEQLEAMEEALKELETPFGPIILSPPFEGWDARWGRISVKKAGTTENGSVYCHASMFLAFARALRQDGDGLYEILWRTLPTNPENPPEINGQVPTYLANYYYGLKDSQNFGRSSQHYGTGTVAWMLLLLIEGMAGVKSSVDGLWLQPCLPEAWSRISCRKRYKNAIYHIAVLRDQESAMYVDGVPYTGKFLPYEEGRTYEICMKISAKTQK